jgi:hypothetical protein
LLDIVFRSGHVPDGEPECEFAVQRGSGEESLTAGVYAIQQITVLFIGASVAKTHQ